MIGQGALSSAVEVLRFPPTAFPKGKPIQKNLDTHYVNLEALFRSLAQEGFGGTVLMVFEEGTEALIVFREGTIISAFTFGTGRRIGLSALSEALGLAKTSRAYVDVFKLEHEMLVPVLPLLHGEQVKAGEAEASLEALVASCGGADFVGAVVAGDRVPEAVGLLYGGVPVGWFDAQGAEMETPEGLPSVKSGSFRAFVLANADTFAAINLTQAKLQVAGRIRDILFDELKEMGMVLYVRCLEARGIERESQASKPDFMRLIEDIERAFVSLRGPGHARAVAGKLTAAVDTLMDVGF